MQTVIITRHAVARYHQQAQSQPGNSIWRQGDDVIRAQINRMWCEGEEVPLTPKEKALKLKKYGVADLEKTRHRRWGPWVITMFENRVLTVHYKTRQERERDRQRRQKENGRCKKRKVKRIR